MLSKDILLKSHILYLLLKIFKIIFNVLLYLIKARYILEIINLRNIILRLKLRNNRYTLILNII